MAYDVSALGPYTEEPEAVIHKILASGVTSKYMTIQPGIKSAETINIQATEFYWQSGSSCGFTASGDTTFSQRTITVGKVKINGKWCERDIEPYFLQKKMAAGSKYDILTYREDILADIQQKIARRIDKAIWAGDTASGDPYLSRFDGLEKIINAASDEIVATPAAWSVANSRTILQTAYAAVSDDMLASGNVKCFMGLSEARDYRIKLGIDNLYHITGAEGKLYIENTDIEIIPTFGLSGTKHIYLCDPKNLYLGTDLMSDTDSFDLFYAKEADEIRFVMNFKMGTQVAFPDQIVKMLNT